MELSKIQKITIKKLTDFNSNKETNYLYIKHSVI